MKGIHKCIDKCCLSVVLKTKESGTDYTCFLVMFGLCSLPLIMDLSSQHNLKIEDGEDLRHDFERLKQAMEMVGFLSSTKKQ